MFLSKLLIFLNKIRRHIESSQKSGPIEAIFNSVPSWAKMHQCVEFHRHIPDTTPEYIDGYQADRWTDKFR